MFDRSNANVYITVWLRNCVVHIDVHFWSAFDAIITRAKSTRTDIAFSQLISKDASKNALENTKEFVASQMYFVRLEYLECIQLEQFNDFVVVAQW